MLSRETIIELFEELNQELAAKNDVGEIGIVGGCAMCLVYQARNSTKDVDAVFAPTAILRKLAAKIAEKRGLEKDWLNDAVRGYLQGNFKRVDVLQLSHLRVWSPEPKYLLAMKCLSARWDSLDKKDVIFLIQKLTLRSKNEVFEIIEGFYPKKQIPAKTQFFIEEVFENKN